MLNYFQALLVTLRSGIPPGSAQGTVCDAGQCLTLLAISLVSEVNCSLIGFCGI